MTFPKKSTFLTDLVADTMFEIYLEKFFVKVVEGVTREDVRKAVSLAGHDHEGNPDTDEIVGYLAGLVRPSDKDYCRFVRGRCKEIASVFRKEIEQNIDLLYSIMGEIKLRDFL